jgi:hypothetical protein
MHRSLVALAAVLLSGVICGAQEKPPVVQAVIQAGPEKIKKVALTMFMPGGYSIDSDTASQLKISRALSSEEIASYNTAHWTSSPVANCRRVHTLILLPVLPGDQATSVTMQWDTACHADGWWKIWSTSNEKDTQWMRTTLADLKAKIEGFDQRH